MPFLALQRGLLVLFIGLLRVLTASQRLQRRLRHKLRYKLLVAWSLITTPRWLLSFVPRSIRKSIPEKWRQEMLRRI